MAEVSALLKAFAALLWPILGFVALWMFRQDIRQAFGRLKKGKIFGQEFELDENLQKLETSIAVAEKETVLLPPLEISDNIAESLEYSGNNIIDNILKQAAVAPRVSLIMLSAEIDKQARRSLAARGLLRDRRNLQVSQALTELVPYGFPTHMAGSFNLFREIRNKIIHGGAANDDDIVRAIDSGIIILKTLNELPREISTIYHPGVIFFSDEKCIAPVLDAKGVIIETKSLDDARKSYRIFPTTKSYFQKGKEVSWEWNMHHIWGPSWYKDPDSSEIKPAWRESAEFIGRHLDEI